MPHDSRVYIITTGAPGLHSNQEDFVKIDLEPRLLVETEHHVRYASSVCSLNLHICIESQHQTEFKSVFVSLGLLRVPNGQRISM